MHHESHDPEQSDDDRTNPFARFISFDTEDGNTVIYDNQQHPAWIWSDTTVPPESIR